MVTWSAYREWAEECEEAVVGFRRSIDQAANWIEANEDEAIELLMEQTDVPAEYKKHMKLSSYASQIGVAQLESWYEVMNVVTGFTSTVDLATLIFEPTNN